MIDNTKSTYNLPNKEEALLHNLESGSKTVNYHKFDYLLINNLE